MSKIKPNTKVASKKAPVSKPAAPAKPRRSKSPANGSGEGSQNHADPPVTDTPPTGSAPIVVLSTAGTFTWESFKELDLASVGTMAPAELAGQINVRLDFMNRAISGAKDYLVWSLRLAYQIGQLAQAAKDLVSHGTFGDWCREQFPQLTERTLQRYMAVAKTTTLSDLEAGATLQDVYRKLGMLGERNPKKASSKNNRKAKTSTNPTTEDCIPLPELLACLKSLRVFIQTRMEELTFEMFVPPVLDELAAEIAALSTIYEQLKIQIARSANLKPVSGVEINAKGSLGAPQAGRAARPVPAAPKPAPHAIVIAPGSRPPPPPLAPSAYSFRKPAPAINT